MLFFKKKKKEAKEKKKAVPIYALFRYATTMDRVLIVCALICSIAVGALIPVSIIFFGQVLGGVTLTMSSGSVGTDVLDATLPAIYLMLYIAAGSLVAAYVSQVLWVYTGESQGRRIRNMYVHAILRQDMAWFDKSEEGSLTTRLAADTDMIQDGISEKFGQFVQSIAQFIAGLVVAFTANWILAFVVLATYPILFVSSSLLGKWVVANTVKAQSSYAEAGKVAEQAFAGIRTVYAFSLQARFIERYEQHLIQARKAGLRRGLAMSITTGIFFLVLMATYALTFWYGTQLINEGRLQGYKIVIVLFGIIMGTMGLNTLPNNLSAITGGCGAAHSVFSTIERVPDIDADDTTGHDLPADWTASVELQNIGFHYPTRPDIPILDNFQLSIPAGKTTAFVGPSGSGKSTIMQLLLRFYDPIKGQVLLDGKDLKTLKVSSLRESIGYVGQEPVLFNLSIRQNVKLGVRGHASITDEQVEQACKQAYCHDFIMQLPDQYDTIVGENAVLLSGGQKQRIAIARAILKNPKILLLDEATSALDTQSERLVQHALEVASKDRTTIVIAHRLSTVRNADNIVVMQKGVIVESGTHSQLVEAQGVYHGLVKKQEIAIASSGSSQSDATVDEKTKTPADLDDAQLEQLLQNEKDKVVLEMEEMQEYEKGKAKKARKGSVASVVDGFEVTRRREQMEKKNRKKQAAPLRRVLMEMRTEWLLLFTGMICSFIAGCVFPAFSYVFAQVVVLITTPNVVMAPSPMSGTNLYAFLLLVVGIASLIGFGGKIVMFETAGEIYTRRLRKAVFAQYLKQEIGFYDQPANSLGSLTTRLAVDSKNVNEMITKTFGEILQIIATGVIGVVLAFIFSWQVTLVVLAVAPFLVFGSMFRSKIEESYGSDNKKATEQCGQVAAEAIKEIRTVAALNQQSFFETRFFKATERPHQLSMRRAWYSAIGTACSVSVPRFAQAITFYAGVRFMANGWITYRDMFSSMMMIMMSANGVGQGLVFQQAFESGKVSAISVFELMDRKTDIDPDLEGIEPKKDDIKGAVSFENIDFAYPTRPNIPVFKGQMNLKASALTKIALVGPSGCGKSTTIGMLERFYDCSDGMVRLDDYDVKKFSLHNLRSHLSIVQQEPIVFDMSIGENICYGYEGEITQDQMEEAAKLANIYDFIKDLPDGFDTRVGDKGSQLSGGQKQRIAIARALVRKPKVLLLDEATSALDSESEKIVQEALDKVLEQGGRTTITIAHRLSTIQNSDVIAVVSDGQIKELGSHQDLLALNGIYADMVAQQSLQVS
ncbi:P-loop containing nucleoside triphosphate hydrolase protein [Hesseltinella vesiculosa]|uniref:P-loop containing nucleoside triphosphate hydrolase protein n=1 Tax=Hesseltinella vesiculosa TaxID=101127 RepID=A0A1X2GYG2_9FUNG|nr:P-loop containing nucleoside triphosphate hydrolase protein [Hesseltinella vesiculosa]